MDPLSIVSNLYSVVKFLRETADKVQPNRHECLRLAYHAENVLVIIEDEVRRGVSEDMLARLSKLKRYDSASNGFWNVSAKQGIGRWQI